MDVDRGPHPARSRRLRVPSVEIALVLLAFVALGPVVSEQTAQPASRIALTAALAEHPRSTSADTHWVSTTPSTRDTSVPTRRPDSRFSPCRRTFSAVFLAPSPRRTPASTETWVCGGSRCGPASSRSRSALDDVSHRAPLRSAIRAPRDTRDRVHDDLLPIGIAVRPRACRVFAFAAFVVAEPSTRASGGSSGRAHSPALRIGSVPRGYRGRSRVRRGRVARADA